MGTVNVLIVDDSGFFRRRIRELLEQDAAIRVIGEAANGQDAIRETQRLKPDVVTMDIEMPGMDGITAVREIMRRCPTAVLMFSSLTFDGAKPTLDALDAGAVDFLPKRFSDLSGDADQARRLLRERVLEVGRQGGARRRPAPTPPSRPRSDAPAREQPAADPTGAAEPARRGPARAAEVPAGKAKLLVIGTSTGGPVALQKVLVSLPANYPLPILLIQHMPGSFTTAFAARLNQLCQIEVREAREGDRLRPGLALLAPGGVQLGLRGQGAEATVRLFDAEPGQFYKPSVDIAFSHAAKACPGGVLGVVLTGMGADGCKGAADIKRSGGLLWAQDEASSVIYGMPAAVARAGLTDQILGLDAMGPSLARVRG